MENTEAKQKVYTQQELEQLRKDTIKYYKDKNSVLAVQAENEELQAKIAEAQLRGIVATIKRMQLLAGPTEEEQQEAEARMNEQMEEVKKQAETGEDSTLESMAERPIRTLKKD
jgi:hypothetical protein